MVDGLPNKLFENAAYEEQLKICCKNAKYMEITSLRSLETELAPETKLPEEFEWEL